MDWKKWLTAILQIATFILEALRKWRSDSVRQRAASDGGGVLLGQLNPGASDSADTDKSAKS